MIVHTVQTVNKANTKVSNWKPPEYKSSSNQKCQLCSLKSSHIFLALKLSQYNTNLHQMIFIKILEVLLLTVQNLQMHEVNNSLKIHSQSLFGFLDNLVFPLYVSRILDNFDLECPIQTFWYSKYHKILTLSLCALIKVSLENALDFPSMVIL